MLLLKGIYYFDLPDGHSQFAISLWMIIFFMILQILWRTCKKDVLDQIDIPPLREEIHWLQFR